MIALFSRLTQIVGFPRSIAEIYGMFFASTTPLCMDDILARLGLSRGATSQGIKQLRALGAIRPVLVPADRRTYYEIEDNLRKVAAGFLKEQVLPQLDDWPQRLERVRSLFLELPDEKGNGVGKTRADDLARWHKRTLESVPSVLNLIGKW